MKRKIVITALVLLGTALPAASQHYLGVRGGYGMGFGSFYQGGSTGLEMENVWGLLNGGIAWKYYNPQDERGRIGPHLAGISMEVEFLQKAYEFHVATNSDRTYRRTLNSIHVPLIWQPHINMMGNRFRLFLNAGVWASYHFPNSKVEYFNDGVAAESYDYESILIRDNPFGYGLCGGVGFDISWDRWTVSLEGRFYYSFGDILRNRHVYPNSVGNDPTFIIRNPWRSPVHNINISASVFYRLTDGWYNPEPNERALKRRQQRDEAQLLDAARIEQKRQKNGNESDDEATESSQTDTEGH